MIKASIEADHMAQCQVSLNIWGCMLLMAILKKCCLFYQKKKLRGNKQDRKQTKMVVKILAYDECDRKQMLPMRCLEVDGYGEDLI